MIERESAAEPPLDAPSRRRRRSPGPQPVASDDVGAAFTRLCGAGRFRHPTTSTPPPSRGPLNMHPTSSPGMTGGSGLCPAQRRPNPARRRAPLAAPPFGLSRAWSLRGPTSAPLASLNSHACPHEFAAWRRLPSVVGTPTLVPRQPRRRRRSRARVCAPAAPGARLLDDDDERRPRRQAPNPGVLRSPPQSRRGSH